MSAWENQWFPWTAELTGSATLTRGGNEAMDATGLDINGVLHQHSPLEAQLQATLNMLPAHAWYALASGQLAFLNERAADYLGLPKDHPLRLGTGSGVDWESHILFLTPAFSQIRSSRLRKNDEFSKNP